MHREEWLFGLVLLLTVTIGWLVFSTASTSLAQTERGFSALPAIRSGQPLSMPVCQMRCEDKSGCGPCERVPLKPGAPMSEACGQKGCEDMQTYVDKKLYQCVCPPPMPPFVVDQWIFKTWWDCNRDKKADCECWTWYVMPKDPTYTGCGEE